MYFIIYKITNILSNKFYIGKHQTSNINDNYFGSGKLLRRAIKKHGKENFQKQILFIFDTEDEMNAKERELVTAEFCLREDTYNLCVGGQGGFSYINQNRLQVNESQKAAARKNIYKNHTFLNTPAMYQQKVDTLNKGRAAWFEKYPNGTFKNLSHTEESKAKIGAKNAMMTGAKNSQFGTRWITNGTNSIKIKSDGIIPDGWRLGRK